MNVDYKAKEQDIEELYSDIKVIKIEFQQKGIFHLKVKDAEEALKIFTGEERVIKNIFSLIKPLKIRILMAEMSQSV